MTHFLRCITTVGSKVNFFSAGFFCVFSCRSSCRELKNCKSIKRRNQQLLSTAVFTGKRSVVSYWRIRRQQDHTNFITWLYLPTVPKYILYNSFSLKKNPHLNQHSPGKNALCFYFTIYVYCNKLEFCRVLYASYAQLSQKCSQQISPKLPEITNQNSNK